MAEFLQNQQVGSYRSRQALLAMPVCHDKLVIGGVASHIPFQSAVLPHVVEHIYHLHSRQTSVSVKIRSQCGMPYFG